MNCHKFVTAPMGAVKEELERAKEEGRNVETIVSPEIQKLYDALGLGEDLEPKTEETPIEWVQIHKLPDFVYFEHRVHVTAGVACQTCHGQIQTMERVRQEFDLTMGWCVNCHRQVNEGGVQGRPVFASLDCAACHY
jgi:formate-dependent nitrite reductase cytochrome c552 subunit